MNKLNNLKTFEEYSQPEGNIKFYPQSYDGGIVNYKGYKYNFTYDDVKAAGLPHYDNDNNTNDFILISYQDYMNLKTHNEKRYKDKYKYSTDERPLIIEKHKIDDDGFKLICRLGDSHLVLNCEHNVNGVASTISDAIYDSSLGDLKFYFELDGNLVFDELSKSLNKYNYKGNRNDLCNTKWRETVIAYLKSIETELCSSLGYKTKKELEESEIQKTKDNAKRQADFDAAGPNDFVDSGFGYSVKKKDYNRSQKLGYDGIELL